MLLWNLSVLRFNGSRLHLGCRLQRFSTTLFDGESSSSFHSSVVLLTFTDEVYTSDSWTVRTSYVTGLSWPGNWIFWASNASLLRRMDWGVNFYMGGFNQLNLSAKISSLVGVLILIVIISPLNFRGIVIQLPLSYLIMIHSSPTFTFATLIAFTLLARKLWEFHKSSCWVVRL